MHADPAPAQSPPTPPAPAPAALEQAFAALASYGHGSKRGALAAIDGAVVAALEDAAAHEPLEARLAGLLKSGASAEAKGYVCRQLALLGVTPASVPALAGLLGDKDLACLARTALEAAPSAVATDALRRSLPGLTGLQKAGAIDSLGRRRHAQSVSCLATLLADKDAQVAGAAAAALGNIDTPAAARALSRFLPKAPQAVQRTLADACLECAERLSAAGRESDARTLYQALADPGQPRHVQAAAARGLAKAGVK